MLEVNGQRVENKKQIAETFNEIYARTSSEVVASRQFTRHKRIAEQERLVYPNDTTETYNKRISVNEVEAVINSSRDSAPGEDCIHNAMLKKLKDEDKKELTRIMNKIWENEKYPKSWKTATIIPILKQGKDPKEPTNYRPISLTSCLGKLLEKIISRRLYAELEKRKLIPNSQSAFRKGRSTIDNIVELETEIREAIANKDVTTAVVMDIEKAYDSCWPYLVKKQLKEMGFKGNLPRIIASFMENRKIKVKVDGITSGERMIEMGLPQGSSLSVHLFSIAVNTITERINDPVKSLLYVDDLIIYHTSKSVRANERKLQMTISKLEKWSNETNFRFSANKCSTINFTMKRVRDVEITINSIQIPCKTEIKYLGMIMDKRLNWKKHIDYITRKGRDALNIMKVVTNRKWGADTITLMKLYRAIIRSKLDYGAIMYDTGSRTNLKKIEAVQNQALRIALGAYRTTPVMSLRVEANEPALRDRRMELSLNFRGRILSQTDHPLLETLERKVSNRITEMHPRKKNTTGGRLEILAEKAGIKDIDMQKINKVQQFTNEDFKDQICAEGMKVTKTDINIIQAMLFEEHSNQHCAHQYYTDGSKDGNRGGTAVIDVVDDEINGYQIEGHLSIFSIEAIGIIKALERIRRKADQEAVIFTDSKSVLQAIQSEDLSNGHINEIRSELIGLKEAHYKITLCWVPAHVGIPGNERADQEAKNAVYNGEVLNPQIQYKEYKSIIRRYIKDKWTKEWEESNNKLKLHKESIGPIFMTGRNRQEEVIIRRLRLGHTEETRAYLLKNVVRLCICK